MLGDATLAGLWVGGFWERSQADATSSRTWIGSVVRPRVSPAPFILGSVPSKLETVVECRGLEQPWSRQLEENGEMEMWNATVPDRAATFQSKSSGRYHTRTTAQGREGAANGDSTVNLDQAGETGKRVKAHSIEVEVELAGR
ncbi:hypothetical protein B0T19DRAFT_400425 [Cercophora scortea]|uniref:Uncharacterized protein n=1 Tax=Cercophora scortea TaxID=314031 RepID=A0AAE0MDZ5_9PEZI|nr:hypothetical protein B0T19DRAFT_400425 [Cercophora scortea]